MASHLTSPMVVQIDNLCSLMTLSIRKTWLCWPLNDRSSLRGRIGATRKAHSFPHWGEGSFWCASRHIVFDSTRHFAKKKGGVSSQFTRYHCRGLVSCELWWCWIILRELTAMIVQKFNLSFVPTRFLRWCACICHCTLWFLCTHHHNLRRYSCRAHC